MSSKPFNKIGSSKSKKPLLTPKLSTHKRPQDSNHLQQPPPQQRLGSLNTQDGSFSKPRMPSSSKLKGPASGSGASKNIYDAIRKQDNSTPSTKLHKPVLNFKKNNNNKLAIPKADGDKRGSRDSSREKNTQQESIQAGEETSHNASLLRGSQLLSHKNKNKLKLGGYNKQKQRQKPIIRQQEDSGANNWDKYNQNTEESYAQGDDMNQKDIQPEQESSTNMKKIIKPNLFKGIGSGGKHHLLGSKNQSHNSPSPSLANKSQVYQEYTNPSDDLDPSSCAKMNYQDMMVHATEINMNKASPESHFQVSQAKLAKQNKRARDLSALLNLEIDLYEELVSIGSTTPFQVYISKIKGGFLKNSSDQAFQDKLQVACQTLVYGETNFSNQCPEDYNQYGNESENYQYEDDKLSASTRFTDFILSTAPVIEQLISPSKYTVMPPTSLLAYKPIFHKFVKCPSPTFIYKSSGRGAGLDSGSRSEFSSQQLSLIAISQKLYICEDQISCMLDLGGTKVAGLSNGKILLWNGQNNKASKMYAEIASQIQSTNFQLPACETMIPEKLSPFMCEGSIVSLGLGQEKGEFWSFDSFAKLIRWKVQDGVKGGNSLGGRNSHHQSSNNTSSKTTILPEQVIQLTKITQKRHLVGLSAKKRDNISGIFCLTKQSTSNHMQITQKLDIGPIVDFYLPKRTDLVYCLIQPSTVKIFPLNCQQQTFQVNLLSMSSNEQNQKSSATDIRIVELILPEIEHDNRQITFFYHLLAVSDKGDLFEVRMLDDQHRLIPISSAGISKQQSDDDDQPDPYSSPSRRRIQNSSFDHHLINYLPYTNQIQKIKIGQNLKCESKLLQLNGLLFSSTTAQNKSSMMIQHVKEVLLKNKKFVAEVLGQRSQVLI